jgi:hypothetical protein
VYAAGHRVYHPVVENRGPLIERHVEIDIDGTRYVGRYSVQSGGVTVNYGAFSKATHIVDSPAEMIARMLLRELVEETLRSPGS